MATTVLDYGLSLQDAISRSADAWDVLIQNWGVGPDAIPGTRCIDAYPAITQPGLSDTIAGVAIGPDSDVDRCWVTFNPSKTLNNANPAYAMRSLSVGNPLMFSQAGRQAPPVNTFPFIGGELDPYRVAARNNLFYFWPQTGSNNGSIGSVALSGDTTVVPRNYVKADGTFATLNVFGGTNNQVFIPPMLHLRFFLKQNCQAPVKRAPSVYKQFFNPGWFVSAGAERIVTQVPVFGRKHIRLLAASSVADTRFRVAILPSVYGVFDHPAVAGQETLYAYEITVGDKTVATAAETTSFCVSPAVAEYLLLYATVPVNGNIRWTLVAED